MNIIPAMTIISRLHYDFTRQKGYRVRNLKPTAHKFQQIKKTLPFRTLGLFCPLSNKRRFHILKPNAKTGGGYDVPCFRCLFSSSSLVRPPGPSFRAACTHLRGATEKRGQKLKHAENRPRDLPVGGYSFLSLVCFLHCNHDQIILEADHSTHSDIRPLPFSSLR